MLVANVKKRVTESVLDCLDAELAGLRRVDPAGSVGECEFVPQVAAFKAALSWWRQRSDVVSTLCGLLRRARYPARPAVTPRAARNCCNSACPAGHVPAPRSAGTQIVPPELLDQFFLAAMHGAVTTLDSSLARGTHGDASKSAQRSGSRCISCCAPHGLLIAGSAKTNDSRRVRAVSEDVSEFWRAGLGDSGVRSCVVRQASRVRDARYDRTAPSPLTRCAPDRPEPGTASHPP